MRSKSKIFQAATVLVVLAVTSIYFFGDNQQATADFTQPINNQEPDKAVEPAAAELLVAAVQPEAKTPSFYEQAEARREQRLIEQEEADRIAKLKSIKENSVDCKFWKQQQKNSSNSEKIAQKIDEFCVLHLKSSSTSSANSQDTAAATSATSEAEISDEEFIKVAD